MTEPTSVTAYLLAAALASVGCGHYGYLADDGGRAPAPQHPTVAVTTVATPAHWRIDAGRLTAFVVDELASRGLEAHWSRSTASGPALRCAVRLPPWETFGTGQFVEARSRCRLTGPPGWNLDVERTRHATVHTSSVGPWPSDALVVVGETAAQRALDAAVDRISRRISTNSNATSTDSDAE